jgi:EmrB/QacA subfamily drug resistance transporter
MAGTPDPRRWKALGLICTAVFMTVLDVSIVNVALPAIRKGLHFNQDDLQWVITAYAITFGGLLLLGGRAADYLGRRRVFFAGLALFTAASLTCGLATSETFLIVSRAVQGLGAAIVSPAALSIVTTTFDEGPERNKALGIWGAVAGSGAAVGVMAGGFLTQYAGWEWVFFVNVPVGAACLLLTPRLVRESRVEGVAHRYDLPGAVTITGALIILVFAISKAPDVGWSSARTIGLLAGAAVLHALFVAVELRTERPLMPFGIFRLRTVLGANVVGFLLGGAIFGSFFLLTLYMQLVLRYSALQAGVAFLTTAGTAVVAAGAAQALVTRVGVRRVLVLGMLLLAFGQAWYAQISVHGTYQLDLLPGYLATGVGIAFAFVPVSIAALAGVGHDEAGLASGLINTSQQIGGALGTAVVSTVALSRQASLQSHGATFAAAATSGYARGFWIGLGIALAGAAATLVFIRRGQVPAGDAQPPPEPASATVD